MAIKIAIYVFVETYIIIYYFQTRNIINTMFLLPELKSTERILVYYCICVIRR